MNTRLRLRDSFRLSAFGYVCRKAWLSTLNDALRLTQPIRGHSAELSRSPAHPVDEDAEFELNYAKQSQFQKSPNERKLLFTKGLWK